MKGKGGSEDAGSIIMQQHYINGENKSIVDSRGALGGSNVPIGSIDLGKKAPLVRGGSDRGFGRSATGSGANSLYKQTLQKSRFAQSPMGPPATPDSFNSMGSDDTGEDQESEKADAAPKLKIKASSFRNPKGNN